MKKLLVLFCFSGMLLMSCGKKDTGSSGPSGYDPPDEADVQKKITIMSFNTRYCTPYVPAGNTTPDVMATANAIKSGGPDVVLLQEIDVNTGRSKKVDEIALLSEYTGMKYYFFAKSRVYDGGDFGVAILSKYAIEDPKIHLLPFVDASGEQRVMCETKITFPGGNTYTVATAHLDLIESNRLVQIPEINRILSESAYPVIFGGDMNASPGSATINLLDAASFERTCKQNCLTIPSTAPNREIDFITVRPADKFNILSHNVITGVTASDHLPVVAVLEKK